MDREEFVRRRAQEKRKNDFLKYPAYRNFLLEAGEAWDHISLEDRYGQEIRISPELDRVWEVIKREKSSEECRRLVNELLKKPEKAGGCKVIHMYELRMGIRKIMEETGDEAYHNIWFGTTADEIKIRPGLYEEEDIKPLMLGDNCVHALMAGRTGSGKSNALHAIITGLMYEYAPWELNLNLADFKIVELSKYGNTLYKENGVEKPAYAPHVGKIAATDSMEYVLSIMYDMYEKMDLRQKVFAALGIQKLSQYRELFEVILPREILIVDEFQQMYELASAKQAETISQLIKMITKLGRATGYHLFFASQSMTGTVRSDVLANFKLRICLPAGEDVSSLVLGNKAAAELTGSKSRGFLIANGEGGGLDANEEYRVPYLIESGEKSDLKTVLVTNAKLAERLSYDKGLDFYREESIRPMWGKESSLESDYEKFFLNTRAAVKEDKETEDYLLLGDSCVFARSAVKRSSLEYISLKIGDRKNVLCIGDSIYQRAYMLELLAIQYKKRQETNVNFIVHGDQMVKVMLKESNSNFQELPAAKFTEALIGQFKARDLIRQFHQLPPKEREGEELEGVLNDMYQKGLGNDGQLQFKRLKTQTFWINGFHMLSDLMEELSGKYMDYSLADVLKHCTSMGIRLIMVGTKAADIPVSVFKSFGYYLIQSNDESNFAKMSMQRPKEYKDTVLRFKAVNEALNRQKPNLYILPQDEKLVKTFDMEMWEQSERDGDFFYGI